MHETECFLLANMQDLSLHSAVRELLVLSMHLCIYEELILALQGHISNLSCTPRRKKTEEEKNQVWQAMHVLYA